MDEMRGAEIAASGREYFQFLCLCDEGGDAGPDRVRVMPSELTAAAVAAAVCSYSARPCLLTRSESQQFTLFRFVSFRFLCFV